MMKVHLHQQPANVLLIYYLNSKVGLNKQFQTGVGDFMQPEPDSACPQERNTRINHWSAILVFMVFI